jgi:hypothetical protein
MPVDESLRLIFQELVNAMNERRPTPAPGQGNLQPFDEGQETFASYLQRVDNFFVKKITEDVEKVKIFINALSSTTHQMLFSLTAPDIPRILNSLTELLQNHIHPQASVYEEQHKFMLRTQNEG